MITTYRATVQRSGKWWAVEVHGLPEHCTPWTQGRTLTDARRMARDLVACHLDIPLDTITVELAMAEDEKVTVLRAARAERAAAAAREQEVLASTVRALRAEGYSQGDIAEQIGLTTQRVSQVLRASQDIAA